jgi:ABC-2 type transport system permease protein
VIVVASQMVATAIATEKENKTLETLLSAPVSRKTVVSAKLLGAGIAALIFAGIYMIGLNFYTKGLMGGSATSDAVLEAVKTLGIDFGIHGYLLWDFLSFSEFW